MKTFKIYTLGCKVNQYDTQYIRERVASSGFRENDNGTPSDIYIINTCTVTQKADNDSLHYIRRARRENPHAKIIVTGCLAQLDQEKINALKGPISIIKNKDKKNILKYMAQSRATAGGLNNSASVSGISSFKGHTRAFLKIQDGCDNFCTYCKVPLVRGRSRSRPEGEIVSEAKKLVENGFKEIVLCGICLGAYGKDLVPKIALTDVIEKMEQIKGLSRIRLSSIEAGDVTDKLINKMADSDKLCPHLHIPIQSGDDKVLKMMNRGYSRAFYINLIKKIRRHIPLAAITTDVLVGFPGESEANFRNTLDLVRKIMPLRVHAFPYSRRMGTKAADSSIAPLNRSVIKNRIAQLTIIADACAVNYRKQFIGRTLNVLVESQVRHRPGFWEGYSDAYLKVLIKSKERLANKIIAARLMKVNGEAVLKSINGWHK